VSPTTELLVIRHGETDWNREHRFQGQLDVPLNATGQAQAEALARRLAGEPWPVLVASDLTRARQTAEPLARAWGQREVPAVPGLREQAFGVLEGLTAEAAMAHHAAEWQAWLRFEAGYALPGGGESNLAFSARVLAAVDALAAAHAGGRVVLLTHGGVLDMLWRAAQGESLSGPRRCPIPNTGLNRLRWAAGRLEVLSWGDADHWPGGA
jgi:probable phosphoglycerate mutase